MSTALLVVLVLLAFFGGCTIGYWTCRYEFKELAEVQKPAHNSDYAAAMRDLRDFSAKNGLDLDQARNLSELLTRLNSAVKAQQNCA